MKFILSIEELLTMLQNPKESLKSLEALNFEERVSIVDPDDEPEEPTPKKDKGKSKNKKVEDDDPVIDYEMLKKLTAEKLREGHKEDIVKIYKTYNCKNLTGLDEMFYSDYYEDIKDL